MSERRTIDLDDLMGAAQEFEARDLRALLDDNGLSCRRAAHRLGVSPSAAENYVNGRQTKKGVAVPLAVSVLALLLWDKRFQA